MSSWVSCGTPAHDRAIGVGNLEGGGDSAHPMRVGSVASGHPEHVFPLTRDRAKEGEPTSIMGERRVRGDGLAGGDSPHGSRRAVQHEQRIRGDEGQLALTRKGLGIKRQRRGRTRADRSIRGVAQSDEDAKDGHGEHGAGTSHQQSAPEPTDSFHMSIVDQTRESGSAAWTIQTAPVRQVCCSYQAAQSVVLNSQIKSSGSANDTDRRRSGADQHL